MLPDGVEGEPSSKQSEEHLETQHKSNTNETIKDITENDNKEPLPKESVPKITVQSIKQKRIERLIHAAEKEDDVDKSDQLYEKAGKLAEILQADSEKFKKLPPAVKEVEEENIEMIDVEMEAVEVNTANALESVKEGEESAEQKLSKVNITAPVTTDAHTGGESTMSIDETIGGDAAKAADHNVVPAKIHKDIPLPMDQDDNNPDVNRSVKQQLLGTEQEEDGDIEMEFTNSSSEGVSANAQEQIYTETQEPTDIEVDPLSFGEMLEKRLQDEIDEIESQMDTTDDADTVAQKKRQLLILELKKLKADNAQSKLATDDRNIQDVTGAEGRKAAAQDADLAAVGKDVPDFRQVVGQLHGLPFGEKGEKFNHRNIVQNKAVYQEML